MNSSYRKAVQLRPWVEWLLIGGACGLLLSAVLWEELTHYNLACISLLPRKLQNATAPFISPNWTLIISGQGFVFGCLAAISVRMMNRNRSRNGH
jgi:hypothetical protein